VSSILVGVPQGGIISPLLMNFTLNGMEAEIEKAKKEFKNKMKGAYIRYREIDGYRLSIKSVGRTNKDQIFKERDIACKIIRYADDFIVLCGSESLLNLIKINIQTFLKVRGLEIHPDKSRTIKFSINTPFDFLGYTFNYLIRTKNIYNKFLQHSKPEYRLQGRPRLFVYPAKSKYEAIKIRIKNILKTNYNIQAYRLISILNPILRG
jgi:RNA-directed DNA polymerase